MNLHSANIKNLTSLWQSVSEPFGAFHTQEDFDYAWMADSGWPNRLWFNRPLDELNLAQIRLHLIHLGHPLKVPYWGVGNEQYATAFQTAGFQSRSVQIGMSKTLDQNFPKQRLSAHLITDETTATACSNVFQEAFGYYIHPKQLISNQKNHCYLYTLNDELVGSGILHITDQVAGIHAIGVPPAHRRKGYAEQIMFHLLGRAFERGCTMSTLQASDLGKGLYLKLGYQEDFKITTYQLNN